MPETCIGEQHIFNDETCLIIFSPCKVAHVLSMVSLGHSAHGSDTILGH